MSSVSCTIVIGVVELGLYRMSMQTISCRVENNTSGPGSFKVLHN